jgi:hypothetical protein
MRRVMYALSQAKATIFRNNVGVAVIRDTPKACLGCPVYLRSNKTARRVKYGLCPGSSDIIGWTPVTVTPDMVGSKVAVFTAVEVKTARGRTAFNQVNFLERLRKAGGIARIVRDEKEI